MHEISENEFALQTKINTIFNLVSSMQENTDDEFVIDKCSQILEFIRTNRL